MSPEGQSGLSVLQALIMEGDTNTIKTILQFSPSSLDISIALITTGTAAILASHMRVIHTCHQFPSDAIFGSRSPQRAPRNGIEEHNGIVRSLDKMVAKFQNSSLSREVVSKGNLSQVLKVLARSTKFQEDRKTYLCKADMRVRRCLCQLARLVELKLWSFSSLMERGCKPETTGKEQLCTLEHQTILWTL